ncbi:MAG: radical SAM protein [Candidatus Methanofastidiosia archaeon]
MGKSDIVLVFPPQWELRYPHLALPSLTAWLDTQGWKVKQYDGNLWFLYELLSAETLKHFGEQLKDKEFGTTASQEKAALYLTMLDAIISRVNNIFERNIKGEGLEDMDLVYLKLALDLVSSVFSPTEIDLYNCKMPYSPQSVGEILQAAKDSSCNPFYSVFEERIIPQLLETDPQVAGISVTATTQLIPAVTLATLLRAKAPHLHITLGGNILSRFADEPSKFARLFTLVDSIVLFDGEPALPVLLDRLETGQPLEEVPNLVTCHEGRVHRSPHTVFVDVNALPAPSFRGLDLERYFFPQPVLSLLSGRGCYWHRCAFCVIPHGYGRTYRARSIDQIVEDLEVLTTTYKVRVVHFPDESIAPGRLDKLCDAILQRGLDILWMTFARTDPGFTPELCSKLYRAGCRVLAFGLESGCQRVLDFMNKGTTVDTASRTLRNSSQAGIWNHVSFFFGFPTETREEAQKTIQFVLENRDVIDSVSDSVFMLDYQSSVYCDPERYGVTRIYSPSQGELTLTFDYEVLEGMIHEEAQKVYEEFQGLKKKYHLGTSLEASIDRIISQETSRFNKTEKEIKSPAENP